MSKNKLEETCKEIVNFMVLWDLQEPGGYTDLKLIKVILDGGIFWRQRPTNGKSQE